MDQNMKTFKKVAIVIAVLVAIGAAVLFYATDSASKLTEYDFGSDKVASINAVIGETRKATGVNVGTNVTPSGSMEYKQYTYETASMLKDLSVYSDYLQKNGWLVIKSYNLNDNNGEMQLSIESADSGKILIMSIAFEQDKYAIRISKGDGTLTRK
jgi:hypothetical protein